MAQRSVGQVNGLGRARDALLRSQLLLVTGASFVTTAIQTLLCTCVATAFNISFLADAAACSPAPIGCTPPLGYCVDGQCYDRKEKQVLEYGEAVELMLA
jgi:hypothetical protein